MSGEGSDTAARVVQSERAARYREQAKHFQQLASTELQPRARAQLLGLAEEYNQLAACRHETTTAEQEFAPNALVEQVASGDVSRADHADYRRHFEASAPGGGLRQ